MEDQIVEQQNLEIANLRTEKEELVKLVKELEETQTLLRTELDSVKEEVLVGDTYKTKIEETTHQVEQIILKLDKAL